MSLKISHLAIGHRAFSERPMTFVDTPAKNYFSDMLDLIAIETGNQKAREYWQRVQLKNLLTHASARSSFWRKRIAIKKLKNIQLVELPILSRSDVVSMVASEGSLVTPADGFRVATNATSGSSGTRLTFFCSEMNGKYNHVRYTAQYLMERRDLTLNRTRLRSVPDAIDINVKVEKYESWAPQLQPFLKVGRDRVILIYKSDIAALQEELQKENIGYLVAQPRFVEALIQRTGGEFFKRAGIAMWIPVSEEADASLREEFGRVGISVRANYSSEEVGPIGFECSIFPGNYHVATSNVIVEVESTNSIKVGNKNLGRVLLTHLHSYATPFIRYDVGDLASLSDHCECGHDGPTLSNVYGRKKRLLKHRAGHATPFLMKGGEIKKIVKCSEYRVRQTDLTTLNVELGGVENITTGQIQALTALFKIQTGDEFNIVIRPLQKIDWGSDIKKLAFRSDVV
jgi:phenylacetate-coenzyme A ligase PaaK-like adenylate-forming protein